MFVFRRKIYTKKKAKKLELKISARDTRVGRTQQHAIGLVVNIFARRYPAPVGCTDQAVSLERAVAATGNTTLHTLRQNPP